MKSHEASKTWEYMASGQKSGFIFCISCQRACSNAGMLASQILRQRVRMSSFCEISLAFVSSITV